MNTKTNHGTPIELLEGNERTAPVGSGAPSGFAAAERSANQTRCGGEERSDELESLAVSPGEDFAGYFRHLAANFSVGFRAIALAFFHFLHGLIPIAATSHETWGLRLAKGDRQKPDSEAPKERSGRRNSQDQPPKVG